MAIWQFRGNIIPPIKEKDSENEISWTGLQAPPFFGYYPQKESWSQNIIQFGEIDRNCFEYIYFNGELSEIVFRIDLREPFQNVLQKVVDYAKEIDAVFFLNGIVFPADFEIIKSAIKMTKEFEYCRNPRDFIASLDQKKNEEVDGFIRNC